jgi:hypothetical protein
MQAGRLAFFVNLKWLISIVGFLVHAPPDCHCRNEHLFLETNISKSEHHERHEGKVGIFALFSIAVASVELSNASRMKAG